jgi:hypothetical protein
MTELEIEKNATDKSLFKFDSAEPKEKKAYRHKKIAENIDKRLKEWHKYVGLDINNPGERVDINVLLNTVETLKNILVKKELMNQGEFDDMFYITADNSLKILEVDKDKIKDNVRNQRMNSIIRGNIPRNMMGPKVIRN